MSRPRCRCWLVLIALVLAGCGSEPPEEAGPSPATVAVSDGWLAVIAVAADPSELDPLTRELLPLGETSFVAAPSGCFDGLPAAYADVGYLLGFLAEERSIVDALVERAGRRTLFVARVRSRCTD